LIYKLKKDMRAVILQNEEIHVKDNWEDFTTGEYIELMTLYSESKDMLAEIFLIKFISILTGKDENYINNLYEEDLVEIQDIITDFQTKEFKEVQVKEFIINGVLYSWKNPNNLTLGEKISIKVLEKGGKTPFDSWLNLLAILVRPAKTKTNEFGETEYELDKFDGNIEILNKRKELFKQIPGVNSMFIINSFIGGRPS